jgi:hypothetical protein
MLVAGIPQVSEGCFEDLGVDLKAEGFVPFSEVCVIFGGTPSPNAASLSDMELDYDSRLHTTADIFSNGPWLVIKSLQMRLMMACENK